MVQSRLSPHSWTCERCQIFPRLLGITLISGLRESASGAQTNFEGRLYSRKSTVTEPWKRAPLVYSCQTREEVESRKACWDRGGANSGGKIRKAAGRGAMAVLLETTLGDLVIDLYTEERPRGSESAAGTAWDKFRARNLWTTAEKFRFSDTSPAGFTALGEASTTFAECAKEKKKRYIFQGCLRICSSPKCRIGATPEIVMLSGGGARVMELILLNNININIIIILLKLILVFHMGSKDLSLLFFQGELGLIVEKLFYIFFKT